MSRLASRKVFRPLKGFIWNLLLLLNGGLLVFYVLDFLILEVTVILMFLTNAILIPTWFLWVRKFFTVEIRSGKVYGPAPGWARTSVLMREVDFDKTEERGRATAWLGYHDVWSLRGNRVRLYSWVLSHRQTHKIIDVLEKYPFRESAVPPIPDK